MARAKKLFARPSDEREPIGWREWVALPALGVGRIKAKVDTGARSSSIHAFDVERFRRRGRDWVRFALHPIQRRAEPEVLTECELLDVREVRSSTGHSHERYAIRTELTLLEETWPIDLTLANRDSMGFRMLLGREAVRGRFLVDPARSYLDRARVPPRRRKRKT